MENLSADIIKLLFGTFVSLVIMYVGFINALRTEVRLLKDKVERLEKRQDSHSKKNDEIIALINELKVELIQKLGSMATDMGKLSSDVENINRVFTINDEGIRFKTKKQ